VLDQHTQSARGQPPAIAVEQIHPVVAQQIGFDGLGVLVQERVEAEDSPTVIPVSRP
jgi:hypothetical protein